MKPLIEKTLEAMGGEIRYEVEGIEFRLQPDAYAGELALSGDVGMHGTSEELSAFPYPALNALLEAYESVRDQISGTEEPTS